MEMPAHAPDPAVLVATRLGLQSVAEHVLAPALHAATGHIGLRATPGGFGTPWFPAAEAGRRRIRVDGLDLVVEDGAEHRRTALTSVRAAADLAGMAPGLPAGVYPPATPLDPDARLHLDHGAVERLARFYGVVDQALGSLRHDTTGGAEAGPPQLWPEHFDLALTIGEVNYGGSPGDAEHPEPYLYVGPWTPPPVDGGFWNEAFGASRTAPAALRAGEALAFFQEGVRRLAG